MVLRQNSLLFYILSNRPGGDVDQIMASYAKTFFVYKYLKNIEKLTSTDISSTENVLRRGYQDILRYRSRNGGFVKKV